LTVVTIKCSFVCKSFTEQLHEATREMNCIVHRSPQNVCYLKKNGRNLHQYLYFLAHNVLKFVAS